MARKETNYYTKGISRKKSIYTWTASILKKMGDYYQIQSRIFNGQVEEAFAIFQNAINQIIIYNPENLGYIIQNNMANFGEMTILKDLFRGIFGIEPGERRKPGEKPLIEPPEKKIYYYGTSKGVRQRQRGKFEIVFIKGMPEDRLRSLKTGRFLKMSKKLKGRIKKERNT